MIRYFLAFSTLILSTISVAGEVSILNKYVWSPDALSRSSVPPMWDTLRKSPTKPMASIESADKSAAGKGVNCFTFH